MLFEATVKFHEKKPFIFNNRADVHTIEKGKPYDVLVNIIDGRLNILRNEHDPLCALYTDNYECRQLNDKYHWHHFRTFVGYKPKDKRKENSEDVDLLELTTDSKALAEHLSEKTSKRVLAVHSVLSYTPSKEPCTSLLSSDSPEQKYRGFLNLLGVILVVTNLQNIINYTFVYTDKVFSGQLKLVDLRLVPSFVLMVACVAVELGIQTLYFRTKISRNMNKLLTSANLLGMLGFHACMCRIHQGLPPLPSIMLSILIFIVALKLTSYYQHNTEVFDMVAKINSIKTNSNYRALFASHEIDNNNLQILLSNRQNPIKLVDARRLAYFMMAPTLCYQLSYPRNSSIRGIWLAKRFIEYGLILGLEFVIWLQYYQPQLDQLVDALNKQDYSYMELLGILLKMSVPTILMWIGGFYMLFQVHMNILAEVLRFADRRFYDDWWNCRTINEYWRLWNLPVHRFCLRHVYNPLLRKGYAREVAAFLVFFVSAIGHEYVVSIPLGFVSCYAFLAILLQSPIQYVQLRVNKLLKIENSQLGNVSFWVTVCVVGQPICIAIYYYLYTLHQIR